jgi:ElaB/YqjD/DUF883 family membrane-anchored ribosome-binding protein
MAANSSLNPAIDEAASSADHARKSAANARAYFDSSINELATRAERAVQEGLASLKARSGDYADIATDRIDTAQRYMTERVQERPMTATLVALGLGVLVGFVLSGGRR